MAAAKKKSLKLQPLGERVVVQRDESEEVTAGGIEPSTCWCSSTLGIFRMLSGIFFMGPPRGGVYGAAAALRPLSPLATRRRLATHPGGPP